VPLRKRILSRTKNSGALIVEERLAVSKEELQIADLWSVDSREVNLGHTAPVERVPEPARIGIGGTDGDLGAARPARLDTWSARSELFIS
jgi:hypothetical protein